MDNYSNLQVYDAFNNVKIYIVNIDDNFNFMPYQHWFSKEVWQKILAYRFVPDRLRAFSSQMLQRYYLAELTNIPPRDLVINYNEYNKPYLEDRKDFKFNISHCENTLVMATAIKYDIGIDIEVIDPKIDVVGMGEIVFSQSENELINNSPDKFFRLWTKKEALIKAVGTGFGSDFYQTTNINLDDIEITEKYCIRLQKIEGRYLSVCLYWE